MDIDNSTVTGHDDLAPLHHKIPILLISWYRISTDGGMLNSFI